MSLLDTDREHEQLFIYETLREGISYMPSAFPVTYPLFSLLSKLRWQKTLILHSLVKNETK
jgi:hypothetical protein